jgi:hypothetical protein
VPALAELSAQLIVAAPLAFLLGLVIGLGLSSAFQIVRKKEIDELRSEHGARDYDHDRGSADAHHNV